MVGALHLFVSMQERQYFQVVIVFPGWFLQLDIDFESTLTFSINIESFSDSFSLSFSVSWETKKKGWLLLNFFSVAQGSKRIWLMRRFNHAEKGNNIPFCVVDLFHLFTHFCIFDFFHDL